MNKEMLIKKIKENKKLCLILSIVFISGFIIGIISVIIVSELEPNYYFAIDDIGLSGTSNDPFSGYNKLTYDASSVGFGTSGAGTATPDGKGFLMRFDLRNKPNNWKKCEISLYVFYVTSLKTSCRIYLFEGNWTEEEWDGYGNYMRDIEIYWKIDDYVDTNAISNGVIGFEITDITEYINDITTNTFSIAVFPRRIENYNSYGSIYSSEWDGTDPLFPYVLPNANSYKNYLPQLIWS